MTKLAGVTPVKWPFAKSTVLTTLTKVFSALKTQVPQPAPKRFGVYQKACFRGKKKENSHIHQRAFKVFVGDPFAQHWCIDFGLLQNRTTIQGPKIRPEKGTQTQTSWSGYLRVGWGSSTWRGGGQTVRWETKLFGGVSRDFCWDIPGVPEKFENKSLCSILGECQSPNEHWVKDLRCLESHDLNHGLRDFESLANRIARFEVYLKRTKIVKPQQRFEHCLALRFESCDWNRCGPVAIENRCEPWTAVQDI